MSFLNRHAVLEPCHTTSVGIRTPITLFCCSSLLLTFSASAADRPSVEIVTLATPPVIDGEIGDDEWSGAAIIDGNFIQIEPEYGQPSPVRTVVRIGQSANALYVAFTAYDPDSSRLGAAVTQRDGEMDNDDSVAVLLDTFSDKRTAYAFGTNALATQWDGRIANNGRTVDKLWDEAWICAARRYDDRWTAEFEIPFAILRFPAGDDRIWRINLMRTFPRRLETALWSGPAEDPWRVTAFGSLTGIVPPDKEKKSWQAIPYAIAAAEQDKGTDFEVGGDLRWRPSSSLAVDLTVNPDFALIEADVEEINLTRFELFIPEKRPFFLEGTEMYSQRIRQFYSRRIGDITWGGKSIGNVGQTNFSAIVTSGDLDFEEPQATEQADYAVARAQRSLPGGSTIGFLAANRRLGGQDQGSVGLDTTLFFTETLGLTAQLIRVHGPTADGGLAWFVRPAYDSSTTHFHVRLTNLDQHIRDDFNAVGFLRDDDRREFDTNFTKTFWVETGAVEKVKAGVNYNRFWSQEDVLRSWVLDTEVKVVFRSGWEAEIEYFDEFKLFEKEFRNDRTELKVGWDGRDGRSFSAYVGSGVNYDSDLMLYGGEVAWKFGDSLRFEYSLTRLELDPDPELETTWIHVLETLYAFNPDLYIKLFVQTNEAIDKLNVQVVGVWRFNPPFGAVQIAYQRGTSELGEVSDQGNTLFTKLSWVF
ncbi:MAG: carbohydrate binding family 9 domain-containing protein [Acidobacteria bacterium]|nr:carbohydrate binding family 9 domain-containing protein [Candidatus Sulfomarinibacter kjeldsenii]